VQSTTRESRRISLIEPIFEPLDDTSGKLVELVLKRLKLAWSGPKAKRYGVMVSSIIHASLPAIHWAEREKEKPRSKRKAVMLGMAIGNDNWTLYRLVGSTSGSKVLKAFEKAGYLVRDPNSGRREFYTTESGKIAYNPIMTCWSVSPSFKKLLKSTTLRFQETGRPLMTINEIETYWKKELRKQRNDAKNKVRLAEQIRRFGQEAIDQQNERIKALLNYWREHPLMFPDGNGTSCATRVFSDSSLRVGGRLYGSWTILPPKKRLECTIDGEVLVQLDICASQPTLLSVLLGVKMRHLGANEDWNDPYIELTGLGTFGVTDGQSDEECTAAKARARGIAKDVLLEIIGTGNVEKDHPSEDLVKKWSITQVQWDYFKAKLIDAIPALEKLEPRYDSKGNPTGYLNGAGFLAYHESEIMLKTLEALRDHWDVPAYPVHDCLLVKVSDWEIAYSIFAQTICDYVEELTGTKVIVPIKREGGGLPEIKFRGVYGSSTPQHLIP
jgi:hypothetical protein